MKYQVKIISASTVEEIPEYWSTDDYIQLLDRFNYPDAEKGNKENLRELLMMAITDFEPNEAAAIVLDYKLSDALSEGQIDQISNDMLLDKIAEEYPEISLHDRLFHVNQLLFKAYNGKFPNTKATALTCAINPVDEESSIELDKEAVLKILGEGLADSNLVKRLFTEQMTENKSFPEAEAILWQLKATDNHQFEILTSEYWISKDDLIAEEFEASYEKVEEAEEH